MLSLCTMNGISFLESVKYYWTDLSFWSNISHSFIIIFSTSLYMIFFCFLFFFSTVIFVTTTTLCACENVCLLFVCWKNGISCVIGRLHFLNCEQKKIVYVLKYCSSLRVSYSNFSVGGIAYTFLYTSLVCFVTT